MLLAFQTPVKQLTELFTTYRITPPPDVEFKGLNQISLAHIFIREPSTEVSIKKVEFETKKLWYSPGVYHGAISFSCLCE